TGDPGSRPGRHFFIRRAGRQEHLKKKSSGPRSGFLLSIISLCVELANWCPLQLQAPQLAKKVPCTDAVCEGGRGGGAGDSTPLGLPNGTDKGGEWGIHCIEQYSNEMSGLKSVTPRLSSK